MAEHADKTPDRKSQADGEDDVHFIATLYGKKITSGKLSKVSDQMDASSEDSSDFSSDHEMVDASGAEDDKLM